MCLSVIVMSGCLAPRRTDYVSSQPLSIADPSAQADQLWEATLETLRQSRFPLDRVDRRAGVITTMPVNSQHFFEAWRHDVDTREDFWEATLNPLRRRVEVTLARDETGWTALSVAVHKQRRSAPDRQINSTGAAYQYFDGSLPTTAGEMKVPADSGGWHDIGRDGAMEEYLLRAITDRAGLVPRFTSHTTLSRP